MVNISLLIGYKAVSNSFFFVASQDGCSTLHCVWQRGLQALISLSDDPLLLQGTPSSPLERTQAQLLWQKIQN